MNMLKHEAAYFCHGMPGSAHDAKLLQNVDAKIHLITPNLLHAATLDPMAGVLQNFDTETKSFPDGAVQLVGFSVGAMVAIQIAAARPNRVGRLTLISPAAPLSLGNFLPDMAGKPVFSLAMNRPRALKLLTFGQGLFSSIAPGILIKQLFAKCGAAEKELLADPRFLAVLKQAFSNSFRHYPDEYIRFIQSYVEDWSGCLSRVTCPVELWHGEQDTWSPIAMSRSLEDRFSGPSRLNAMTATEHYSTLAKVSLTAL